MSIKLDFYYLHEKIFDELLMDKVVKFRLYHTIHFLRLSLFDEA